jgi:hypothetical protein
MQNVQRPTLNAQRSTSNDGNRASRFAGNAAAHTDPTIRTKRAMTSMISKNKSDATFQNMRRRRHSSHWTLGVGRWTLDVLYFGIWVSGVLYLCICLSHSAADPVLGSPDFHPTPQHSFGWRGDGSGRFPGATPVTEWSATRNVRWSTDVGRSYSSPIVTDKFVFVTSEPNLLFCLDRTSGKVLWKVEIKPADLTDANSRSSVEKYDPPRDGSGLAAATPLTDGQSVYVVLANGLVGAVDLDGKRKWTVGIDAEPTTRYGRSSSPILIGGKLIVHLSNLYAFDPATGQQLWVNTEAKSAYGTPTLLRIGDLDLIVTPNGDVVRAADGQCLNSDIGRAGNSSPIACDDGVVCFGDSEVRALRLNAAFKEEELWNGTGRR